MAAVSVLVGVPGFFFLQVRRIGQHDRAQVAGARRAEDPAAKTLRDEPREVTAVIEVGMRQYHGIDARGVDGKRRPVPLPQLLEPLKQPAVHEDAMASEIDQMLRAGDRTRRSQKRK